MSFRFLALALAPTKPRSQAVPRPPAKSSVSDPRPLIPKVMMDGRALLLPNTGQAQKPQVGRFKGPLEKVKRRSTHALSPVVPSTIRYGMNAPHTPESKKKKKEKKKKKLRRPCRRANFVSGVFRLSKLSRPQVTDCGIQYAHSVKNAATIKLLRLRKLNRPSNPQFQQQPTQPGQPIRPPEVPRLTFT